MTLKFCRELTASLCVASEILFDLHRSVLVRGKEEESMFQSFLQELWGLRLKFLILSKNPYIHFHTNIIRQQTQKLKKNQKPNLWFRLKHLFFTFINSHHLLWCTAQMLTLLARIIKKKTYSSLQWRLDDNTPVFLLNYLFNFFK